MQLADLVDRKPACFRFRDLLGIGNARSTHKGRCRLGFVLFRLRRSRLRFLFFRGAVRHDLFCRGTVRPDLFRRGAVLSGSLVPAFQSDLSAQSIIRLRDLRGRNL